MVLAAKNLCPFWRRVLSTECPLREGQLYKDENVNFVCMDLDLNKHANMFPPYYTWPILIIIFLFNRLPQ